MEFALKYTAFYQVGLSLTFFAKHLEITFVINRCCKSN